MMSDSPERGRELTEREKAQVVSSEMLALRQEVTDQWPDVIEITATLRELRQRNHFADMVYAAIGGDKKSA